MLIFFVRRLERQNRKMILHHATPQAAGRWCDEQRAAGRSIGFVPTMGALHAGHLSLLRRAKRENDSCCASLFVNPLQFNDAEDYASYPRDTQKDLRMFAAAACDMVFSGALGDFFPGAGSVAGIPVKNAGPFGRGLEEQFRPGHLDGVRTIVEKLFAAVGPCRAYFGEKDFQQCLVVADLARQFDGVEVVACPTVREADGLACSSRNVLLSADGRKKAAAIYRALLRAKKLWDENVRDAAHLRRAMDEVLAAAGAAVEYADLRDPLAWSGEPPAGEMQRAQALVAARIGKVRLIDNLRLDG